MNSPDVSMFRVFATCTCSGLVGSSVPRNVQLSLWCRSVSPIVMGRWITLCGQSVDHADLSTSEPSSQPLFQTVGCCDSRLLPSLDGLLPGFVEQYGAAETSPCR